MTGFYRFIRTIVVFVFRIIYRIKIVGSENIPDRGGYILCGNHRSMADAIFLASAYKKRQLYTMIKVEATTNPVLGWIFKKLDSFPVDRGKPSTDAIDWAVENINKDRVFMLFPEGTRSRTGELLPPKSGVGLICAETKADILPVAIYYEGTKLSLFKKVTVRFGKMMPNESFEFSQPLKSAERKRCGRMVMEEVAKLLGEGHE